MHVPPQGVLRAHSVAEAFLFVSLTYCPECSRRPIRAAGDLVVRLPDWVLPISCGGCQRATELRFQIDPPPNPAQAARINPTSQPSNLIAPAGWLVGLIRAACAGFGGGS